MNRSGNECYVALHHICLNEVIVNQFLPDDFELSLQLLDPIFANLRVEIPRCPLRAPIRKASSLGAKLLG